VKVGKPVAEYKAVDVLGLSHLLQCSGQTIHQYAEGRGLRVGQVAEFGDMPLGFGDEITPIGHRRSG
jgi:hypothetical protein